MDINMLSVKSIKTKQLILIRHGESVWNEVFNRGIFSISFPFRLIKILIKELILFLSSDSFLFDSPLSSIGIKQCYDLKSFLNRKHIENNIIDIEENENNHLLNTSNTLKTQEIISKCIDILNDNESLIVSSPLRRCIETVSLSLYDRLNRNCDEKIYLVSTLQELTRNIDGLSLSVNNRELPPISKTMKKMDNMNNMEWKEWFNKKIDFSMKDGVKSKYKRGDDRINGFIEWIFNHKNSKYDTIIISGHSIWFKMFFQLFLAKDLYHDSKQYKIANGGVVTLQLIQYSFKNGTRKIYKIDPNSIHVVFKGFETDQHNKRI